MQEVWDFMGTPGEAGMVMGARVSDSFGLFLPAQQDESSRGAVPNLSLLHLRLI